MPATATHYVIAIGLAVLLTLVSVVIHYEALRLITSMHPRRWSGKVNIGVMIVCLIVSHFLEAMLFGAGYWLGVEVLSLGFFTGSLQMGPLVYFYFSLETFTTQSLGDIFPVGPLRLIASVEPLVGLILIGWSTSYTFLHMRRNWHTGNEGETI